MVQLGLQGYTVFFLFLFKNILWYSLEPPLRGCSNEYYNLCFEQKHEKYQNFYLKTFRFGDEIFNILKGTKNDTLSIFEYRLVLYVFVKNNFGKHLSLKYHKDNVSGVIHYRVMGP